MKPFYGLLVVLVVLNDSISESLVRRKRFFNSLWPTEEVKADVQSGLIYAQLPADYMYLLPGVNDHKTVQRRSSVQQPIPVRFVHPTRMSMLMQPHHQQNPSSVLSSKTSQTANLKPQIADVQSNQQQLPRIVMKPVAQNPKLNPSITLKTKEQAIPDLYKNQRFVPLKPSQNAAQKFVSPFSVQQQLPIKKVFDASPAVFSSEPLLTLKTAPISDFYYTKEFQDLLNELNIRVEMSKLPPINDVMSILGTENNEETFNTIREVTQSPEGIELIKSYLDQNQSEGDEFYHYDEDIGAGEIKVNGDVKFVQSIEPQQTYGAPQQTYGVPHQTYGVPGTPTSGNQATGLPSRPTTTGTLTGENGKSWWKPTSWFSSSPSTKLESLQKDAEILKDVVPSDGSVWQNINYIGNFLKPAIRTSIPIQPISNVQSFPRRVFFNQPFSQSSIAEGTKVLPSVRMTEAQFQDMVKTLRLTPLNSQHLPQQHKEIVVVQEVYRDQSTEAPVSTPAPLTKFESPINVQSVSSGISQETVPLPSTFTQFDTPYELKPLRTPQSSLELPNESSNQENRRNFMSISEPQRLSPFDFIATGTIHQANPAEVLKKSRSLMQAFEEEKSLVSSISDLTEQHQN